MFIDIHSHISDERFDGEVDAVISRAKDAGVGKIVCVGCSKETSKQAIKLAKKFDCVYAAIGFHPNNVFEFDEEAKELLRSAKDNKKVVAIGEIGLDFYDFDHQISEVKSQFPSLSNLTKEEFIEKQKEVFISQLEIAKEIGLPIMIHMREATGDTLQILESNMSYVENGGLLHCFSGSLETTKRILNLGLHFSIGGSITFKNSRVMPEVLSQTGLRGLTLETDCPYLCPEPFRGQRNEPKNIPLIAKRVSEITGATIEEVEKVSTENAYEVFPRLKNGEF